MCAHRCSADLACPPFVVTSCVVVLVLPLCWPRLSLQAVSVGSHVLAASFASKLASIHCNQGHLERAQAAVEAAGQQLGAAGQGASFAAQLCHAELAAACAQAALMSGGSKEAWQQCRAAVASSTKAVALVAADGLPGRSAGAAAALHARALLTAAQWLAAQGDTRAAREQGEAALAAVAQVPPCSSSCYWQAAALLFLAEHAVAGGPAVAPQPAAAPLAVWGLPPAASRTSADPKPAVPANAAARAGRLGTRAAAVRSRGKQAAAAEPDQQQQQPDSGSSVGCPVDEAERWQRLWAAFALSRELPVLSRWVSGSTCDVGARVRATMNPPLTAR